jgi:hypothetical protein
MIMPVSAAIFSFGVVLVARNHYRGRVLVESRDSQRLPKS